MAIKDEIQHVVVLMLENRSFDHMLAGTTFPSPVEQATTTNWNPGIDGQPVRVSFDATSGIDAGPDHGHLGVMWQLTGSKPPAKPPFFPKPYTITNSGYIASFEDEAGKHKPKPVPKYGAHIMKCQPETNVPVLSTLAREFAVCDHWFCSVPGQTWPNRNYAHAGTSDGTDNIVKRWYDNPTIFGTVINAGKNYRIYADGIPQCLVFRDLWLDKLFRGKFRDFKGFAADVQSGDLPEYTFIEPHHFGKNANSQHPDNPANDRSFHAGEALIKSVYDALTANAAIWNSTLLIITYDEHGGFYDHVAPPTNAIRPDKKVSPEGFEFDMLGVRVPTVLVSPWIARGSVDPRTYDHSSIPASVRALFAPNARPLGDRDAVANSVWDASIWLAAARADVPRVSVATESLTSMETIKPVSLLLAEQPQNGTASEDLPEHEEPWAWLAFNVAESLRRQEQGESAAVIMASWEDTTGRLITRKRDLDARKVSVAATGGPPPIVLTDSDKLAAFGKDVMRMLEKTSTPS